MKRRKSKTTPAVPPGDLKSDRGPMSRRAWIGAAAGGAAVLLAGKKFWPATAAARPAARVTVYRSPLCSCCGNWIGDMRKAGFTVDEVSMDDLTPMKRTRGVPETLYACHTADVEGFVIEGHVPPDLVTRVLRERPAILGLAVPGMPQSAPGMDIGHEPYDVISFTRDGQTAVFARRS
jgi:hypothetical protein